ncbi:helix-turn-helix domain-containing protein [Phenylobacterium sp.]|uniref:helix-turn-helix domain-containing protein n=1 Tax=Phenylobacterium sp. TaxID=1871053 RepID=UPI0027333ECC|nr:helix-turn-helix transcriptional regulator [Phenylobacterium sp.]MDP3172955.1 helix-turn-helix transcriptional regulator [Phenylobacterium sp.]MDP3660946.1 helix-turn-helix transcriptional regulator [Phenylobacterium sp.]
MASPADQWRDLGERLRKAREYLELTQDEAARVIGISRPSLSQVENGRRKVDAVELAAFAKLYGQSVETLAGAMPQQIPEDVQHLARATRDLSDQDRAELLRFAEFLQARSKKDDRVG